MEWFYINTQGQPEGPFTSQGVLNLFKQGMIQTQTLVRQGNEGPLLPFEQWRPELEKNPSPSGTEPSSTELSWYYKQAGTAFGPIPYAHLEVLIHAKAIEPNAETRASNQASWAPAQERLEALFQKPKTDQENSPKGRSWRYFLDTAPLWQLRLGAFLVDIALGQALPALLYAPLFLFLAPYCLLAQWRWGATPGKLLFGLRIYLVDQNTPLSLKQYTARFLGQFGIWLMMGMHLYFYGKESSVFFVATSLLIFLMTHALAALNQRRQALHDHICGSYVGRAPRPPSA